MRGPAAALESCADTGRSVALCGPRGRDSHRWGPVEQGPRWEVQRGNLGTARLGHGHRADWGGFGQVSGGV